MKRRHFTISSIICIVATTVVASPKRNFAYSIVTPMYPWFTNKSQVDSVERLESIYWVMPSTTINKNSIGDVKGLFTITPLSRLYIENKYGRDKKNWPIRVMFESDVIKFYPNAKPFLASAYKDFETITVSRY